MVRQKKAIHAVPSAWLSRPPPGSAWERSKTPMLSIRDCLDYCDLTDEDVAIIAEHHDIPEAAAAQIACGLVQTREGTLMLTQFMLDLVDAAEERGDPTKAKTKLGWMPEITAQEMCKEMVANDLAQAKQHALLKRHGYQVSVSVE